MAQYRCPKCSGVANYTMFAYSCQDCGARFESLGKGIYEESTLDYNTWFRQKFAVSEWKWVEQQVERSRQEINKQLFQLHEEYETYCIENGITPSTQYSLGKRYEMVKIEEVTT